MELKIVAFIFASLLNYSLSIVLDCNYEYVDFTNLNDHVENHYSCNVGITHNWSTQKVDKITGNHVDHSDDDVKGLRAVKKNFDSFPTGIEATFRKLRAFVLTNSRITEITKEDLKTLTDLEFLDLSFNKIKIIHKEAFHKLNDLKVLKLNNNNLTSIDIETFKKCKKIRSIFLQENQFDEINWKVFNQRSIQNLGIDHQAWTCSAETLQNISQYFHKLIEDLKLKYLKNLSSTTEIIPTTNQTPQIDILMAQNSFNIIGILILIAISEFLVILTLGRNIYLLKMSNRKIELDHIQKSEKLESEKDTV